MKYKILSLTFANKISMKAPWRIGVLCAIVLKFRLKLTAVLEIIIGDKTRSIWFYKKLVNKTESDCLYRLQYRVNIVS